MQTILNSHNDTDAIVEYIRNEFSWKKLYFNHFSMTQKILYFLPISFVPSPVWGTYFAFHVHSWWTFLISGTLSIAAIWLFFKQKGILEKKVFEKKYKSACCKNALDFELEKLRTFLGEQNTDENRVMWKDYLKTSKRRVSFVPVIVGCSIPACSSFLPHDSAPTFFLGFASFVFLGMAFSFIHSPFCRLKIAVAGEAFKLICELDMRELGNVKSANEG
ncbi:hypothetical protein FACS1894199_13270 [Bacteroidia bacterium]|nr:hypothetical protein FACS1894199_13270 [Bacteroidia bacterium]